VVERGLAGEHPADMRHDQGEPSDELERLRLLLFPGLSRDEGQRRIELALEGAADADRAERIEALAADPGLMDELLRRLPRDPGDGST
jgi:hypothetical protein